jgi:hypothetical protein
MVVKEDGSWCNTTAGEVHYAWDIPTGAGIYRQIEIHCSNQNHSGSWTVVQPRTSSDRGGSAPYSIPSHLSHDIMITSCVIRGCYHLFGSITVYQTNNVSVVCAIPGLGLTASLLPPSTTLAISTSSTVSLRDLQSRPTSSNSFSTLPVESGGNSLLPLHFLLIFLSLAVATTVLVGLAACTVYHVTHRSGREFIVFEDTKLDPSLEPKLGPIASEMTTPYPSLLTLTGTGPALEPLAGEIWLTSLSLADDSQSRGREPSCLNNDSAALDTDAIPPPPSVNETAPSPAVCVGESQLSLGLGTTVEGELTTSEDTPSGEVYDGTQREECRIGDLSMDDFTVSDQATSSSGATDPSHHYQTSSSGYVTDTSSLVSPLSPSSVSGRFSLELRKPGDSEQPPARSELAGTGQDPELSQFCSFGTNSTAECPEISRDGAACKLARTGQSHLHGSCRFYTATTSTEYPEISSDARWSETFTSSRFAEFGSDVRHNCAAVESDGSSYIQLTSSQVVTYTPSPLQ